MFKWDFKRDHIGLLLVGLGFVALIANTNILSFLPSLIWLSFLSVGGLLFFLSAKKIPLAVRIVIMAFLFIVALATGGGLTEVVPLLFIAIAFLATYFSCRSCWWAIIPAGVFSSLAATVLLESIFPRWDFESIFFLGLSATFSLLYLLPAAKGGKRWAIYPAIFWIIITVLANDPGGSDDSAWVLPLVLILGGGIILWYWRKQNKK